VPPFTRLFTIHTRDVPSTWIPPRQNELFNEYWISISLSKTYAVEWYSTNRAWQQVEM
jgi:hypothetical protein